MFLTGICKYVMSDWLHLQLLFVVVICAFWITFISVRSTRDPSLLRRWGFTRDGLGRSVRLTGPVAALTLLGFSTYGILTGSMVLNWHIVPVLLLYPISATVQQFLIVALVAENLAHMSTGRIPRAAVVAVTAVAFGVVHFPSVPLALATSALAGVTTLVYFRARNLWTLGVFHGLFATTFFFFVLGQDLWKELLPAAIAF